RTDRVLAALECEGTTQPAGTTGFDVVGSWGWLRVEVPGGLVKHPGNNKCGYAQLWPPAGRCCLTASHWNVISASARLRGSVRDQIAGSPGEVHSSRSGDNLMELALDNPA